MRKLGTLFCLVTGITLTVSGQSNRGTAVLTVLQDPAIPVPFIGPNNTDNGDVADQLFLRLGKLGPAFHTTGDNALIPQLARTWRRIDPLVVEFVLDARARWHDGTPVTSADVVFAWDLLRQPALGVTQAPFELIERVDAISATVLRVRFRRRSHEQVYVAAYQIQPLPAHLLRGIPVGSLSTSDFARHPVGNGPFRFVRRVPGQFVELRAVPDFFLGTPGLSNLVFQVAGSTQARLNLFLSGAADILSDLPSSALDQVSGRPGVQLTRVPGNLVTYLLFNSRNPADTAAAHPILADLRVRQALALALDRQTIATNTYGPGATVPAAMRSQAWAWIGGTTAPPRQDLARAVSLLEAAGWRDSDGDGIRDKQGKPLRLAVSYPTQSLPRAAMAVQLERMWRAAGVDAVLDGTPGATWSQRRNAGNFDVDFAAVNQDPTPASLVQSWSCNSAAQPGSSNVAKWCDREFDRLLREAESAADPQRGYRLALERMAAWQPAIVIATPSNHVGVHTRYDGVNVRPVRAWSDLWQWRVRPGAALPRDR